MQSHVQHTDANLNINDIVINKSRISKKKKRFTYSSTYVSNHPANLSNYKKLSIHHANHHHHSHINTSTINTINGNNDNDNISTLKLRSRTIVRKTDD